MELIEPSYSLRLLIVAVFPLSFGLAFYMYRKHPTSLGKWHFFACCTYLLIHLPFLYQGYMTCCNTEQVENASSQLPSIKIFIAPAFFFAYWLFLFYLYFTAEKLGKSSRFLVWVPVINIFYSSVLLFRWQKSLPFRFLVCLWFLACLFFVYVTFFALPLAYMGIDSISFFFRMYEYFQFPMGTASSAWGLNKAVVQTWFIANFIELLTPTLAFLSMLFAALLSFFSGVKNHV